MGVIDGVRRSYRYGIFPALPFNLGSEGMPAVSTRLRHRASHFDLVIDNLPLKRSDRMRQGLLSCTIELFAYWSE